MLELLEFQKHIHVHTYNTYTTVPLNSLCQGMGEVIHPPPSKDQVEISVLFRVPQQTSNAATVDLLLAQDLGQTPADRNPAVCSAAWAGLLSQVLPMLLPYMTKLHLRQRSAFHLTYIFFLTRSPGDLETCPQAASAPGSPQTKH